MSFNHEAVAALPVASNADKALIRALCTRRFAYVLATSEAASNFIAVDPDTGVIPLNLIQNNILFQYDSTDTTTANDGVTCLVSNDGKRFKSATVTPPYSVLTRATTAEPSTPAVGDTYLIPTAATGADWAGKDGQIGIFTARGWVFATSPIGRFLYVKDETAFYHRAASGTWTAGIGSILLGTNSVNLTNVLGATASYVVKVENQTTNAPPSSPVTPTAYIIGPSPTGSWSGNAGRLAICLAAGTFTIITPASGDQIYDKARGNAFTFNGTAWVSSSGTWLRFVTSGIQTSTISTVVGSGLYTYSATSAPTTATSHVLDSDAVITYAAIRTGSPLRIWYSADIVNNGSTEVISLYRDSESTALDWGFAPSNVNSGVQRVFNISSTDALSHTYKVRWQKNTGNDPTIARRFMTLEEGA